MSEQIKVKSNVKTYNIVNHDEKLLCQISFNPFDTNIVHRHKKVQEELQILKENAAAKKGNKTSWEYMKEIEAEISKQIDYLLDANVASALFSIMGAFSIMPDGRLWVEEVLDMIGSIIENETGTRIKKVRTKVQRYTKKYHN